MNKYDVIIFDGDNTAHKAYHVYSYLQITKGEEIIHTGTCYGFLNMMLNVYRKFGHDRTKVMVSWDVMSSSAANRKLLNTYKANRKAVTEYEKNQKKLFDKYKIGLKQVLSTLNILQFYRDGVESDDVIATLSNKIAERDKTVLIITEDKDYRQLITDKINLYGLSQKQIWNLQTFKEKTGLFYPIHFADYLAIKGDSIDGFDGVKGFGEQKTLAILTDGHFSKCESSISEVILHNPDVLYYLKNINEKIANSFISNLNDLSVCYRLAKLDCEVVNIRLYSYNYYSEIYAFTNLMKLFDMRTMLEQNNLYQFDNIRKSCNYLRKRGYIF